MKKILPIIMCMFLLCGCNKTNEAYTSSSNNDVATSSEEEIDFNKYLEINTDERLTDSSVAVKIKNISGKYINGKLIVTAIDNTGKERDSVEFDLVNFEPEGTELNTITISSLREYTIEREFIDIKASDEPIEVEQIENEVESDEKNSVSNTSNFGISLEKSLAYNEGFLTSFMELNGQTSISEWTKTGDEKTYKYKYDDNLSLVMYGDDDKNLKSIYISFNGKNASLDCIDTFCDTIVNCLFGMDDDFGRITEELDIVEFDTDKVNTTTGEKATYTFMVDNGLAVLDIGRIE